MDQNHSWWAHSRSACSGIHGSLRNLRNIRAGNLALPWTRLIQLTPSYPNTSRSTLILFSDYVYISLVLFCYMSYQSHFPGFVQLNNASWRVWRSPLCNYLQPHAVSSLLGANIILLRILFSNTLNPGSSLWAPSEYHIHTKQVLHLILQDFKSEKGRWMMLKRMVASIPRIPLDFDFFANVILIDFLLLQFLSHFRSIC
jgi:hypothetical protein